MNKTRWIALAMGMLLLAGGCANGQAETTPAPTAAASPAASPDATPETSPEATEFVLEYPADMQDLGYTEPVVLDHVPERIACMSTYPVMALYALGANLIAVPSTQVVDYPADLDAEILPGMMSDDFDLESVVSLEPDLVMMPTSNQNSYGQTLESLGIPVYYVSISSQVISNYQMVKNQTQALADAFAIDADSQAAAEALMARFTDIEASMEAARADYEGKSVMVLISSTTTSHYIQGAQGTLGSMLDMLGFTNVFDSVGTMVPLDMETALDYQPDLVVFTGSMPTAEEMAALVQETIAANPDYWNAIDAIANGEYLCLSSNYVSTAGIQIIQNIQDLMDALAAHYGG